MPSAVVARMQAPLPMGLPSQDPIFVKSKCEGITLVGPHELRSRPSKSLGQCRQLLLLDNRQANTDVPCPLLLQCDQPERTINPEEVKVALDSPARLAMVC